MIVHWIWLATRRDISDRVKVELVRHFQDPENVYFADPALYREVDNLTEEGAVSLQDKDLSNANRIIEDCHRENLQILTYRDAAYPGRLRNISDPPLVFYYKGCLPDFDGRPLIGVVGTRSASPYGLTAAKRLGYQIAACGGTVVSGMAYGIDGMAMRGALTAGGTVVGILGCGAEQIYPLSNRPLFEDTQQYGCIMSEFPPGTPPLARNFPRRNRIISGLSCGVLVVEAPEKSGALITARLAADQGRDVFVVPGNIDVDSFVGSNRLLRDGAIAVSHGWDIMSEYEAQFPGKIRKNTGGDRQKAYPDEVAEKVEVEKETHKVAQKAALPAKKRLKKQPEEKKVIDKAETTSYSDVNDKLPKLTDDEQKIVAAISGETLVDDVIASAGLPVGKVLAMLTLLEVKGVVKRLPGKRVRLG